MRREKNMALESISVIVLNLLLMLVLVAYSNVNALPLQRCDENRFYDRAAQICTLCNEICNPLRGTPHLCHQYADECQTRASRSTSQRAWRSTTAAGSITVELTGANRPNSMSTFLVLITVICTVVAVIAATAILMIVVCRNRQIPCFLLPATAVSASKEAIAPNRVSKPVTEINASLLQPTDSAAVTRVPATESS